MSGLARAAVVCMVAAALACTSASGDIRGGELRPDVDAAPPPRLDTELAGASPTSWKGLYRDFFSPNAPGGCGQAGSCHGTPGAGGVPSSGFVCADVDGCWESMRQGKHPVTKSSLVEEASIADPASAQIFNRIRYLEGSPPRLAQNGATMPLFPVDFAFSADDIERMKTWIRDGAGKN